MLVRLYNKLLDWIYPEINMLVTKFEENHKLLQDIHNSIEDEKNIIEKELLFYKSLHEAIIENSPDMVWLKDCNGIYMIANDAIKDGLLFDCDPIGKDDIELSTKAKERFGDSNHTFGEVCGNSDKVIMHNLKPQRFLESGKIKGKMVYLEVFKFPFFIKDELVGVAGIGRDITEYVEAIKTCGSCSKMPINVLEKYEFKERRKQQRDGK